MSSACPKVDDHKQSLVNINEAGRRDQPQLPKLAPTCADEEMTGRPAKLVVIHKQARGNTSLVIR